MWGKMLIGLPLVLSVDVRPRGRTVGAGAGIGMVAKSFSLVAFFP